MAPPVALTPPNASATRAALNTIFQDISQSAKESVKNRIKEWQTPAKLNELCKKTKLLRQVKTIWQIEKEIDLFEFYCPAHIIENSGKRIQVNHIQDFPYSGNVVVQGTVGQGKSIFFRYLASQELLLSRSIPAFVELRKISKKEKLLQHIFRSYELYGLNIDEELFEFLEQNHKTTIFLDAFDEVENSIRSRLIKEIENLAIKYENLRIFISSRPDSGISASTYFRVVQLSPLQGVEYEAVITRYCPLEQMASEMIGGIRKNLSVRSLLTTPLMVALLVFRYKVDQSLPENVASFYSNLFELLLLRHDKTKPGFIRQRESGLGDTALQSIFESLCYLTRRDNKGHYSFKGLVALTNDAAQAVQKVCDSEKVLNDFISITCLLLREGSECKFIHKSVQEYYAAVFISSIPEFQSIKFYKAMQKNWRTWQQELGFLTLIDTYRFNKFFWIDQLKTALKIKNSESFTHNLDQLYKKLPEIFENAKVTYKVTGPKGTNLTAHTGHQGDENYARHIVAEFFPKAPYFDEEVAEAYRRGVFNHKLDRSTPEATPELITLSFVELANACERINGVLLKEIKAMREALQKAAKLVSDTESNDRLFDL